MTAARVGQSIDLKLKVGEEGQLSAIFEVDGERVFTRQTVKSETPGRFVVTHYAPDGESSSLDCSALFLVDVSPDLG